MRSIRYRWLPAGLVTALALAACAGAQAAAAPAWPHKAIRMIAPTTPGSPPDVVGRIIAERLAAALGQPVVVENRPGAIGAIGLQAVAKATPDGYTTGVISIGHVLASSLLTNVSLDMVADLAPVIQINWESHLLVVRASSAWKSVSDMVAHARSQPGRVTFASGGNGTPAHLSGELFKKHTGIDIRHVPFKGAPQGVTAIVSEQVDMMFAATPAAGPYVQAGRLRALATPAPRRVLTYPDVPTMVELGYTGFEIRGWQGLIVPAATPKAIISRMASEVAKITVMPEVRERLAVVGMEPAGQDGSDAFGALIRSETARWSKIAREAGIRAD